MLKILIAGRLKFEGTVPLSWLELRLRNSSRGSRNSSGGTNPRREFEERSSFVSRSNQAKESGKLPLSPRLLRSNSTTRRQAMLKLPQRTPAQSQQSADEPLTPHPNLTRSGPSNPSSALRSLDSQVWFCENTSRASTRNSSVKKQHSVKAGLFVPKNPIWGNTIEKSNTPLLAGQPPGILDGEGRLPAKQRRRGSSRRKAAGMSEAPAPSPKAPKKGKQEAMKQKERRIRGSRSRARELGIDFAFCY